MPKQDLDDILDESVGTDPGITVPNRQPRITNVNYKLAIVGEAPGADEIHQGIPFVGFSGQQLDRFLSRFGVLRDACFIGNICQHRPPSNRIAAFNWEGPEIQQGLLQLARDLDRFQPNCVLLLGGSALHAFKDPTTAPRKKKTPDGLAFVYTHSISDWRGSFFRSSMSAPKPEVKCISSYHPAACLRQYDWTPLLMLDIKRAFDSARFPGIVVPERTLLVGLSFEETVHELDKLIGTRLPIGTDIEGYWNCISCISFAPSPLYSFIVPFSKMDGSSYWTLDEECIILRKVSQILGDSNLPKIWQNGLYDRFCLQYGLRMITRGSTEDIMLKHWELYCELPKALATQASIYTDEPFWKDERVQAETGL